MRYGYCTNIKEIGKAKSIGFDYVEWVTNEAATISEYEYKKTKELINGSAIKCEVFCGFFPWEMKIVGPDANDGVTFDYAKKALERVAGLGGKIAVIGNGGARRVPEGMEMKAGVDQFIRILNFIGNEASKYGIVAVIEPLKKAETNIVNLVSEGIELVKAVNNGNVKLLADFYHMRMNEESMDSLIGAKGILRHVHIANGTHRGFPLSKEEDSYEDLFRVLKQIGYNARISIEADTNDVEKDGPVALKLMKELNK